MKSRFNTLLQWWARWERPLSTASMVIGFSFDLVIAKRPDSVFDNLLLLFYLFVSASCILVLNLRGMRQSVAEEAAPKPEPLLLLLIVQFCFGGLSSNLLILYGKSGTPAGSTLFLGLLLCMLIGNEFLRTRYEQTRFNIAVWYMLMLTYCIISVPTFLMHRVGDLVFLASGAVSVVIFGVFLFALWSLTSLFRNRIGRQHLRESSVICAGILIAFNILYFTNVIPPVPLSLKSIGIYHYVVKNSADSYAAQYEPAPWWEFWKDTSGTYTISGSGGTAYCFASVFAPTGLATPIVHRWEYFDPTAKAWELRSIISFPISGGRAEGYRGFSTLSTLVPGQWRCDVETASGQLIGRTQVTVVATGTPVLQNASL